MSIDRIYDIGTDHLKCNFCVKYFKCTMHYANIQRYALKACPQCFDRFYYTVVHPKNYKIYKVMLVDMGIKIPLITNTSIIKLNNSKEMIDQERSPESQSLWQQFIKTEQHIHNKITSYYQGQIKKILDLLQKTRTDFQKNCLQIRQKFEVNDNIQDLSNNLQNLKSYNFSNKSQHIQTIKYNGVNQLKQSTIIKQSKRKLSYECLNKQNVDYNHNHNKPNAGKSIKDKIFGSKLMKKSSSKQSKRQLLTSRSSSTITLQNCNLTKSIKIPSQTNKNIEIRGLKMHTNNQHEIERNEVNKLLGQKSQFNSYMPTEIKKDQSFTNKNESCRNITESILQMREKTVKSGQLIEIIGQNMSKINFDCYLRSLGDVSSVKILRIIRCSLVDADMDYLLHFLSKNLFIETLIVTNNRLSQHSIQALLTFKERHESSKLKNIYIGNNHINYFKTSQILKNNNMDNLVIYV